VLGGTKQFRVGERLSGLRIQLAQLGSIGGQIIEPGEDQKADD
jgi:hypothetical protein